MKSYESLSYEGTHLWRNFCLNNHTIPKWNEGVAAQKAQALCAQRCGRSSFRQRWNWSTFLFSNRRHSSQQFEL